MDPSQFGKIGENAPPSSLKKSCRHSTFFLESPHSPKTKMIQRGLRNFPPGTGLCFQQPDAVALAKSFRGTPTSKVACGGSSSLEVESPETSLHTSHTGGAGRGRLTSAVGLIMGTAVGPGILGLPAATLKAGLLPSSVTIITAWAYVIASVLLVAELSYAVMAEQGGAEVSFTGLAVRTLGHRSGCVVAAVYALLNYALLVACIAGLGSIVACWLQLPLALVCSFSPALVAGMVAFSPFKAVDTLNRALCGLMLAAIVGLVGIGLYEGHHLSVQSMAHGIWTLEALLPSIPVIVLTLGFHVITPLVCNVVGGRPQDARNAILCGGAVPLAMVLAWNAVITSLAPARLATGSLDPIKLLMSRSTLAVPAVQAFAFAALGTTLIGYSLSFPKQLADTVALLGTPTSIGLSNQNGVDLEEGRWKDAKRMAALSVALGPPVLMAMICPTAFARALDFAGVYANCFLFGVLPPVMAWVYRYSGGQRTQLEDNILLPGGRFTLLVLLLVAIFLGLRLSGSKP